MVSPKVIVFFIGLLKAYYLWRKTNHVLVDPKPKVLSWNHNCVKSIRIWSFSGPFFPGFGLNTVRYSASLHIQSECGKVRARKTPITNTFYAVHTISLLQKKKRIYLCGYYSDFTVFYKVIWKIQLAIFSHIK